MVLLLQRVWCAARRRRRGRTWGWPRTAWGIGVAAGRSATEQLLGARGVGLGDLGGARHAAGHLRGLLLQVVAQTGLLAADLARAGHAETLARTGVGLVLRHLVALYLLTYRSMSGSR